MATGSESTNDRGRIHKLKRSFWKFCENTSVHGLKYIVRDNISIFQRIAWVVVFFAGVSFSTYFCVQMWKKWEDAPVLMSLDTYRYPLKNVPFPAVTICNVNKVSKQKLLKELQKPRFTNISYDVMQKTLRYMTKLDRAINNQEDLKSLNQFYRTVNISAKDLFQILKNTTQTCNDIVVDCVWLGLPTPCMQYFTSLPTDDGMCCTFNGASYIDIELGIQYSPKDVLNVSGNGYRMGLALVLDAKVSDYSVTNGKFDGFKVLVHSSEKFPDVNDRGFVIGPGSETFVAVNGISTFNTEEVAQKVSPAKRQCKVDEEHKLLYFPRYSLSACTVECATKLMKDTCNCRPYFFRANNETKLCELDSYNCISDVYENVRNNGDDLCKECLPPCADIWYEPEISYAPFPGRGFNLSRTYKRLVKDLNLTRETNGNEYLKENVAVLHVYYKEKTGMRYKTDIRFGVEDFISAMGGLLGLGLGMSFISAIEIVSFLIRNLIRLVLKTDGNDNQSDPGDIPISNRDKREWPSISTITTNNVGSVTSLSSAV